MPVWETDPMSSAHTMFIYDKSFIRTPQGYERIFKKWCWENCLSEKKIRSHFILYTTKFYKLKVKILKIKA